MGRAQPIVCGGGGQKASVSSAVFKAGGPTAATTLNKWEPDTTVRTLALSLAADVCSISDLSLSKNSSCPTDGTLQSNGAAKRSLPVSQPTISNSPERNPSPEMPVNLPKSTSSVSHP